MMILHAFCNDNIISGYMTLSNRSLSKVYAFFIDISMYLVKCTFVGKIRKIAI